MKHRLCAAVVALAVLLCGLTACGSEPPELQKFSAHSFDYFDTVTTITGYAESQEAFDTVANALLAQLGEYHRLYDIYKRYEDMENLCTVNELVNGVHRTVTVDQRIIDLLLYAREMYGKTNGMVNVAMGSVLKLWHDHRGVGMDNPANATLPDPTALTEAARHTDIAKMVIDAQNRTVTLTDPAMRLDVGAIAKGYATEQVAKWLEAQGHTGYVLNVGGNVRAVGLRPDGTKWTVGIENPDATGEENAYLAYLQVSELITAILYLMNWTL